MQRRFAVRTWPWRPVLTACVVVSPSLFSLRLGVRVCLSCDRLRRLGCANVSHWSRRGEAIPARTDFVVMRGQSASSTQVLLAQLIKKIRNMRRADLRLREARAKQAQAQVTATAATVGAPSLNPAPDPDPASDPKACAAPFRRDWTSNPVFLCTADCVLWFEAYNGVSHEPPAPAPPSSPGSGPVPGPCLLRPIQDHLTWNDVCMWNSNSSFEALQPPPTLSKRQCPT